MTQNPNHAYATAQIKDHMAAIFQSPYTATHRRVKLYRAVPLGTDHRTAPRFALRIDAEDHLLAHSPGGRVLNDDSDTVSMVVGSRIVRATGVDAKQQPYAYVPAEDSGSPPDVANRRLTADMCR